MAVVRLRKHGKRFEIAAYPNKVLAWRQGQEDDIDEVLQAAAVFSNVSKGVSTSAQDMKQAFGTEDPLEVCRVILEKGELQIGERERKHMYDQ